MSIWLAFPFPITITNPPPCSTTTTTHHSPSTAAMPLSPPLSTIVAHSIVFQCHQCTDMPHILNLNTCSSKMAPQIFHYYPHMKFSKAIYSIPLNCMCFSFLLIAPSPHRSSPAAPSIVVELMSSPSASDLRAQVNLK